MVTITSHIFINIFQTVHFSAVKFTRGNEKNMNFLLISKSPKVWEKSEAIGPGTFKCPSQKSYRWCPYEKMLRLSIKGSTSPYSIIQEYSLFNLPFIIASDLFEVKGNLIYAKIKSKWVVGENLPMAKGIFVTHYAYYILLYSCFVLESQLKTIVRISINVDQEWSFLVLSDFAIC